MFKCFYTHGSPLWMTRGACAAPPRFRVVRAVLKTHVPSGFCFGSRAAPRAAAPSSPILLSDAADRAPRLSGNQGDAAFPHTRSILGGNGRCRCRTLEVQGAQGRVECPVAMIILCRLEEDKDGVHSSKCNAAIWCMQTKPKPISNTCSHDPAAQLRIPYSRPGKATATMCAKHDDCSSHL